MAHSCFQITPLLPREIAISPESKNVPWNTATDNYVPIPDNRPETQPLIIDDGPEEFKPEVRPEFRPKPQNDKSCCTIL